MCEAAVQSAWMRRGTQAARVLLDKLKLLLLASIVVVLTKSFLLDVVVVQGHSMEPSLHPGDYVVMEKLTPRLDLLERGEVVVLEGDAPEELMVKRIAAMGGDDVKVRSGRVVVNGGPAPGEGQTIPRRGNLGPVVVPAGQLFVLGDNGPGSDDSRDFGPVPTERVRGRVIGGLWDWASAASMRVRSLLLSAGWEGDTEHASTSVVRPAVVDDVLAATARVAQAHVTAGGEQVWISAQHGVRHETKDGFTLYTREGTWHYDGRRNTIAVSTRVPQARWALLQKFSGVQWLAGVDGNWSFYEYLTSDDTLDGKATKRIDTVPGPTGYGATLWVDRESKRVVRVDEWCVRDGAKRKSAPTIRLDYDTPIDPGLFIPAAPEGAVVLDPPSDAKSDRQPPRAAKRARRTRSK